MIAAKQRASGLLSKEKERVAELNKEIEKLRAELSEAMQAKAKVRYCCLMLFSGFSHDVLFVFHRVCTCW